MSPQVLRIILTTIALIILRLLDTPLIYPIASLFVLDLVDCGFYRLYDKTIKCLKKDNDWIPTEAVRSILKIRDDFKGNMSETCISQILYELNSIWRNIMRKENEAIKKRLTA